MRVILFRDKRTDNGERAYGVVTEDNHGEMVMAESPFEREEYNCCGANCMLSGTGYVLQTDKPYKWMTCMNAKQRFAVKFSETYTTTPNC